MYLQPADAAAVLAPALASSADAALVSVLWEPSSPPIDAALLSVLVLVPVLPLPASSADDLVENKARTRTMPSPRAPKPRAMRWSKTWPRTMPRLPLPVSPANAVRKDEMKSLKDEMKDFKTRKAAWKQKVEKDEMKDLKNGKAAWKQKVEKDEMTRTTGAETTRAERTSTMTGGSSGVV